MFYKCQNQRRSQRTDDNNSSISSVASSRFSGRVLPQDLQRRNTSAHLFTSSNFPPHSHCILMTNAIRYMGQGARARIRAALFHLWSFSFGLSPMSMEHNSLSSIGFIGPANNDMDPFIPCMRLMFNTFFAGPEGICSRLKKSSNSGIRNNRVAKA